MKIAAILVVAGVAAYALKKYGPTLYDALRTRVKDIENNLGDAGAEARLG